MIYRKWLTLVELLIVMVIFWMIFMTTLTLYYKMMTIQVEVEAKQSLVSTSNSLLEKLNLAISEYTIDYEEYFNRRMVGCDTNDTWDSFSWNVNNDADNNGYCDRYTHYWNSSLVSPWDFISDWAYYHCSSIDWTEPSVFQDSSMKTKPHDWCRDNASIRWNTQPYLAYQTQFIDEGDDIDSSGTVVWDDDYTDYWAWPEAIYKPENIKELYLINNIWNRRMLFRREFIDSWDYTNNWTADLDVENLYSLRVLKLRWFDAGKTHKFDVDDWWVYDWMIDTWACDYSEWFSCTEELNLWWTYNWYWMPANNWEWWVDFMWSDVTLTELSFEIYPTKDYNLAWNEDDYMFNPYIKIFLKTKLYAWRWAQKINVWKLEAFEYNVQTTFNIRNNYY